MLGYNKSAVEVEGQHSVTPGKFVENTVTLVLIHATHWNVNLLGYNKSAVEAEGQHSITPGKFV